MRKSRSLGDTIKPCLAEHIQSDEKFLAFGQPYSGVRSEEPKVEMLIKRFDLLGVKFKSLEYGASNEELFRQVYEHNQYEINGDNIWLMLKTMYDLPESELFIHSNLTLIDSALESPLKAYIWDNIGLYTKEMFIFCQGTITDDAETVKKLLNCTSLDVAQKSRYLSMLKTILPNLSAVIGTELWTEILKYHLCKNTQTNIISYFEKVGFDDTLIEYINAHEALGYEDRALGTEELRKAFFDAVIENNTVLNDRYALILSSLGFSHPSFDVEDVSVDKMDILIDNAIIRMTESSLVFIRENYPDNLLHYIESKIAEYVDLMDEDLFQLSETLDVLKLDVADSCKVKLLEFTDESISVINEGYSDAVKVHILSNNFNIDELEVVLKGYNHESENVKKAIENIAVENIDDIISTQYSIPISLFDALIANTNVTADNALDLFALIIDELDASQFRDYLLNKLKVFDYEPLFNHKQSLIPNTDAHTRILTVITDKKWISSFKIDDHETDKYRAFGFMPRKKKRKNSLY